MDKIITICGSGLTKAEDELYENVFQIGKVLAENGYTICSGGYSGIMEACCKGAKSVNGKTIGITVESWETIPNQYLDENVKMPNLIERLMELLTLADGYVVLKGGSGTLVEFSVALELMNKGLMKEKPLIFFTDFWEGLIHKLTIDSVRLKGIIERNVRFTEDCMIIPGLFKSLIRNETKTENTTAKY